MTDAYADPSSLWPMPASATSAVDSGDAGAFPIYPGKGGYADQSGNPYNQDPSDPGIFLDKAGKRYEPAGPITSEHAAPEAAVTTSAPKGYADPSALWPGQTSSAPSAPNNPAPDIIGQGEQGVVNSLYGTLGQVESASLPGMADKLLSGGLDAAANIGSLIRSGVTDEPIGPQSDAKGAFSGAPSFTPDAPQFVGAPQGVWERGARTLGGYLPAAVMPEDAPEGFLAGLGSRGANVGLPAAGSLAASETSRALGGTQEQQDAAANIGGLLGGGVAGLAKAGPGALRGITDPFLAAVSPSAAERVASSKLLSASTNPEALRGVLSNVPDMLPASLRTTGQLTGDLGVLGAEKAASVTNPLPFRQLAGQQAGARNAALGSIAPDGAPMLFRDHVAADMEARDQALDESVQAARQTAHGAAQAIGGTGAPEDMGAAARGPMQTALDAAKAHDSALYKAVDPDGTLTGNVQQLKAAAADLKAQIAPIMSAQMTGAEKTIFSDVANLKDVTPLRTVVALKAQINDAISDATDAGKTVVAGRLKALRTALNGNLADSISDPTGPPGVVDRYQAWNSGTRPDSAVAASNDRGIDQSASAGDAAGTSGAGGTAFPNGGGPGGPAGTAGVQAQISPSLTPILMDKQVVGYTTPDGKNLSVPQARAWAPPQQGSVAAQIDTVAQPTVDADAIARQRAADASYAGHAQTFQSNPVGPTLKTNGYAGQYNVADSALPRKVFPAGNGGAQAVRAFVKAGAPMGVVSDMAAATLRGAAMNADGTIDPGKFATWQKNFQSAASALPPEVSARFSNAATATQAVADAEVNRVAAMKDAQAGAIGKVIGANDPDAVVTRVGQVFQQPATAVREMGRLADATANNPDARAGLQNAIAQYVRKSFIGNAEVAASGADAVKSDQFQTFLKNNRAALGRALTPAQLDTMQAVADSLHEANRSVTAVNMPGQSATAQLLHGSGMPGGAVGQALTHSFFDGIAATLGAHLGPLGPAAGVAGSEMMQALRSRGVANINALYTEMLLKPQVAKAVLAKTSGAITPQSPIGSRILTALAAPSQTAVAKPKQATVSGLTYPSALRGVSP